MVLQLVYNTQQRHMAGKVLDNPRAARLCGRQSATALPGRGGHRAAGGGSLPAHGAAARPEDVHYGPVITADMLRDAYDACIHRQLILVVAACKVSASLHPTAAPGDGSEAQAALSLQPAALLAWLGQTVEAFEDVQSGTGDSLGGAGWGCGAGRGSGAGLVGQQRLWS